MKIKIFLISFLTLSVSYSFSQEESNEFPANFKQHTLKITPLKLLGSVLPSIELGYERFLTQNTSAQVTLGYLMENIHYKHNQKEVSIAFEAKKYAGFDNGFYFSLETGYYHRHSDEGGQFESNTLLDSNNLPLKYTDNFSVIYNQVNLIPKIGIRSSLGGNFILDAYFGIGIKWVNIKHTNRSYPNDKMIYPNIDYLLVPDEIGYPSTIVNDSFLTVKIPINIRIGYTF